MMCPFEHRVFTDICDIGKVKMNAVTNLIKLSHMRISVAYLQLKER